MSLAAAEQARNGGAPIAAAPSIIKSREIASCAATLLGVRLLVLGLRCSERDSHRRADGDANGEVVHRYAQHDAEGDSQTQIHDSILSHLGLASSLHEIADSHAFPWIGGGTNRKAAVNRSLAGMNEQS